MRSLKPVLLLAAILSDVLAIFLLINLLGNQSPLTINAEHGGSQLSFSSDRQLLLEPLMCANLAWKVESTGSIYVNGVDRTGGTTEQFCPTDGTSSPTFTVSFLDGTSQDFKLGVISALESPSFILLSFAVIILSLLALVLAQTTFVIGFLTGHKRILTVDIKAVLFVWMIIVGGPIFGNSVITFVIQRPKVSIAAVLAFIFVLLVAKRKLVVRLLSRQGPIFRVDRKAVLLGLIVIIAVILFIFTIGKPTFRALIAIFTQYFTAPYQS